MNIVDHKSNVRMIREGEPDFRIVDQFTVIPRAMIHILPECPRDYAQIINICVQKGWLKSVAHMRDYELMLEKLYE